jgi:CBS domain-containing protein
MSTAIGTGSAPARSSALTVECLMRRGPPVADPDDRLAAAAARMRRGRVDVLAVMRDGQLAGIITARDILVAVADGLSTDVTTVAEYMQPVGWTIGPGTDVAAAIEMMTVLGAHHLPVLRDGEVAGVISARDLLPHFGVPRALLGDEPW